VVLLETANITSGIGNGVVMVVLPWLVLELTGSPAAAGLLAALSTIPALVVIPLVGAAIDRFGRKLISVLSDIASALSVIAFPIVGWLVGLDLTWILVLAVIGAGLDPAGYTARKSLIIDAAQASGMRLQSLNGLHEALFAAGWTVGPLLGAGLIATVGAEQGLWVPGVLFIIAAICIFSMRVSDAGQVAREDDEHVTTGIAELTRGFVALWSDKALRVLTIAIMVLAGVYLPTESVILPVHFEALDQPEGMGIVIGALAGGGVLGAFAYGPLSRRLTNHQIITIALLGTALGVIPMAFLPPLWVLAIFGFVLGLSWGPMQPLLNTLVQTRIPADEQGRVFSVQLTAFYVFPPLAMLATGAASEEWGVKAVYPVLAGLLVVTSIATLSLKSIRTLDNKPHTEVELNPLPVQGTDAHGVRIPSDHR
jgi:MFS family permease